MLRYRRVFFIALAIIGLGLASQVLAAYQFDQDHDGRAIPARQDAPTRTPGWGPIITAPPPPPTDTPGGPTPVPSITPIPTNTPAVTAAPPAVSPTPEITGTPLPTYR